MVEVHKLHNIASLVKEVKIIKIVQFVNELITQTRENNSTAKIGNFILIC